MFVLEESQLLEDTIVDKKVRDLYCCLHNYETSGNLTDLTAIILPQDEPGFKLTKLLLNTYSNDNFSSLNQLPTAKVKLTTEEKDVISDQLKLNQDDIASLALVLSASYLQLFVVDNYIGPMRTPNMEAELFKLPELLQQVKQNVDYTCLNCDSSEVYHGVNNPWLIRMSFLFWEYLNSACSSRKLLHLEFLVWKHRLLSIHMNLLLDPVESLMQELRKIEEFIFDHHILNDNKINNTQLTRFNVVGLCCEMIQSALARDSLSFCRKFLEFALESFGMSIEHTGALGKRTRFQHNDISQLVVQVVQKDGDFSLTLPSEEPDQPLPIDVQLDDDTLLPDISFADKGDINNKKVISVEAQLLLQNELDILVKSEVMEESLKDEYILAYIRTIVRNASIWSLKYKALMYRSLVEKRYHRRMDRALRQLEALIKEASLPVDSCRTQTRHRWFYSVIPPSTWQIQRSLGDVSCDLGLFKNALDVYSKIEFWEGIIKCHCALQQNAKAEEIIRQELTKKETPYLYCLLGDVTDDVQYYEKSWELSGHRFARAKKSIGTYHYVRKNYDLALENYDLAHKASPSNLSILSLLAYCCLITENYEKAAECYRNVTYIDDGSFLAWNNLSKAYIKLGQKERAWRTLREAIKCNYEEWKVWDNLMKVSIEIGELDDVIVAWHRLIDIKSSHKDDQTLNELTYALVSRPTQLDADYEKLLSEALKLNARLISTSECTPRVWICYFKLLIKEYQLFMLKHGDKSDSTIDARVKKIINALQRATPTLPLANSESHQKLEDVNRLLSCYDELLDCYTYAFEIIGSSDELKTRWKSFKLTVNTTMKTLEKNGYISGNK